MLQQDDLLTQKIELILEMNGKKLLTELGKLREELSGLKEEVAGLKKATRFGSGATEPQQPYPQQAPPQQWPQAPPQQQWPQQAPPQQTAPERRLDKPIDRNGVAPADVSIEKMFYFGNKR
jgi:hypothetical protein